MTSSATFRPDWLSPPGETVADLLEERHWTQAELATRTGFTKKHINELIAGKVALTPEAAIRLESALGGSARFWLAREAQYQEAKIRRQSEEALRDSVPWLSELPLADMVKWKWVAKYPDRRSQVAECLRFFGVASVDAWRDQYEKPLAAFRKSDKVANSKGAIAAWLRRGEIEATSFRCSAFDEAAFRSNLLALRELTCEPDPAKFVPRLTEVCSSTGVAVVLVPAPRGCPVSGATRWFSGRAILQLSLRYRSNDHLWFTVFHEAAHLLLHGRKLLFLEGTGAIDDAHEQEADTFARNTLIPPSHAEELRQLNSSSAIEAFAAKMGIAPGIVVGRMQKEKLVPWTHFNGLKLMYRWTEDE